MYYLYLYSYFAILNKAHNFKRELKTLCSVGLWPPSLRFSIFLYFFSILQNLAAAAGIGVRPSFAATGMAGIPHAATGLSLQAAIANQAAYGQALPAT